MNKFYTLIINNVIDNLHWSPVDELFVFPIVVVAVVGTGTVGACGSAGWSGAAAATAAGFPTTNWCKASFVLFDVVCDWKLSI